MLVAAPHHRLQASALAGTLGLGHAARLLLAWEKREGARQVERKMKEGATTGVSGGWEAGEGGWEGVEKSQGPRPGRGTDKKPELEARRSQTARSVIADDEAFRQIKSRK